MIISAYMLCYLISNNYKFESFHLHVGHGVAAADKISSLVTYSRAIDMQVRRIVEV